MIAPSEILLIKVLALGFFFGVSWRRFFKTKTITITNIRFDISEDLK